MEEGERVGGRTWSVDGKVFAWEQTDTKADLPPFRDEVRGALDSWLVMAPARLTDAHAKR